MNKQADEYLVLRLVWFLVLSAGREGNHPGLALQALVLHLNVQEGPPRVFMRSVSIVWNLMESTQERKYAQPQMIKWTRELKAQGEAARPPQDLFDFPASPPHARHPTLVLLPPRLTASATDQKESGAPTHLQPKRSGKWVSARSQGCGQDEPGEITSQIFSGDETLKMIFIFYFYFKNHFILFYCLFLHYHVSFLYPLLPPPTLLPTEITTGLCLSSLPPFGFPQPSLSSGRGPRAPWKVLLLESSFSPLHPCWSLSPFDSLAIPKHVHFAFITFSEMCCCCFPP